MISERLGFDGRTIVVAGAGGGGIGTAICRVLAEAGASVAALDVDAGRLADAERAIEEAGGTGRSWIVDVRNPESLSTAADEIAEWGSLHGNVHVAGGIQDQWSHSSRRRPRRGTPSCGSTCSRPS